MYDIKRNFRVCQYFKPQKCLEQYTNSITTTWNLQNSFFEGQWEVFETISLNYFWTATAEWLFFWWPISIVPAHKFTISKQPWNCIFPSPAEAFNYKQYNYVSCCNHLNNYKKKLLKGISRFTNICNIPRTCWIISQFQRRKPKFKKLESSDWKSL